MTCRVNILLGLCVATLFSNPVDASSSPDIAGDEHARPNIVIIVADDMGWNDVGYNGSEINTTNLDQLAQQGVRLDRFYVQPACSPTRTSLMTGKNNQRLGVYSPMSKLIPTGLPLSEKILPEYFKDAGYQTFMVGKWHLGFRQEDYRPTARGFDYFYGNLTGGIGYWDHVHGGGLDWQRNGKAVREEGYATHLQIADIEKLITQRDKNRPMFLYASFNAPHLPNEAPVEALEKYKHIEDPQRRIHAGMVSELDAAIGRIVKQLNDEQILENTLIWFMSDNGGLNISTHSTTTRTVAKVIDTLSFGEADNLFLEFVRTNVLDGKGSNIPFKKGKQSVYEGGVRVPSLIYWDSNLAAKVFAEMLTVQDVLPTLLHAAQLPEMQGEIDGQNAWHALSENFSSEDYAPKPYLTTATDGQAYYKYPWKLIALNGGDLELYHLERDPTESTDIAESNSDMVTELKALLDAFPRAESVHVSTVQNIMNIDFFGGDETSPPWSEVYD